MNETIKQESSNRLLSEFLNKNKLHKKDFAKMIGVTLSYVYNLMDETLPFSTRTTTIERIATVMDISPNKFKEYKIPQEPEPINKDLEFIKQKIKSNSLNIVSFLKAFPSNKRIEIVDILRGAKPLPIDYIEMSYIGKIINLSEQEIYNIWKNRFIEILEKSGMNLNTNSEFINYILNEIKKYKQVISERI